MISSRRHIRHTVSPSIFVVLDGASSGGILYDICESGLALDIVGPDLRAQQVIVDFDLPESGQHFNAIGQIIWKNDSSKRMGLQFMDLPTTSRRLINEWLSVKTVPVQFFTDTSMQSFRDSNGQNARSVNDIGDLRQGDAQEPAMADSTYMVEPDSRGATDLRSSTPQPVRIVDPEPQDGIATLQDFLNRHSVHMWIIAAVCVFLAVIVLGIGIFVYASRRATQVTLGDLKAIVTGLFVESGTTLNPAPVRQPSADVRPRSRSEAGTAGSKPVINRDERKREKLNMGSGIPDKRTQFEVLDSQNRRRLLPRGADGNEIKIERPDAIATEAESATASPGAAVSIRPDSEKPGLSKRGYVSLGSAGEVPTHQVMPDYPAAALQKNVQGEVVVKASIAEDGSVRDPRIVSSPSLLDSTVLAAVRKWRYAPHFNDGEPVEVETQIILRFTINRQ